LIRESILIVIKNLAGETKDFRLNVPNEKFNARLIEAKNQRFSPKLL